MGRTPITSLWNFGVKGSDPVEGVIHRCRGTREAEAVLLRRIAETRAHQVAPGAFASPLVVVVPSAALRLHLSAKIARELGPAVLGVSVQTLWMRARELVQRAGASIVSSPNLFELYVARALETEPELHREMLVYQRSAEVAVGSCSDLLSAGMRGEHLEAVCDALAEPGVANTRGRAIARVAVRAQEALAEAGLCRTGDLYTAAAEVLADPTGKAASPFTLIHGYADATGQALEFIEALLRRGAEIIIDAPPDPAILAGLPPAQAMEDTPEVRYVQPLVDRALAHGNEVRQELSAEPCELEMFDAVGVDAEAREVAYRILEELASGRTPERIAVVARTLEPYQLVFRQQFARLGVPYSMRSAPPGLAAGHRRLGAALEVLEGGGDSLAERWLESRARAFSAPDADLRLALRAVGLTRMMELCTLDVASLPGDDTYPLPLRRGLEIVSGSEQGEYPELQKVLARRRTLSKVALQEVRQSAQGLLDALAKWPLEASLTEHLGELIRCLADELGWADAGADAGADSEAARPVPSGWRQELEALGHPITITRDEFFELVRRELRGFGAPGHGGAGSGVMVHDVTQARALTFDVLFVVGLNREVFPRVVHEDALLGDPIRNQLRRVLPDLALKRRALLEESYLFAQLLSSAGRVVLSWQRADGMGRQRVRSSLVDRLLLAGRVQPSQIVHVPRSFIAAQSPPFAGTMARPRPPREALCVSALAGDRSAEGWGRALQRGLELGRPSGAGDEVLAAALPQSRVAVVDAVDPDFRTSRGRALADQPSPFLGLVGALSLEGADPRKGPMAVTSLESVARCPWQAFVRGLLRVEPAPDPLAAFPGVSPLLLGNTVHEALAQLVGGRGKKRVAKPPPERVREATMVAASAMAAKDGLLLGGLQSALAQMAIPLVFRALDVDWPHDNAEVRVIGGEIPRSISVSVEGRDREVFFRADRQDEQGGAPVFTDYKTGQPLSRGVRPATRVEHLRRAIASGQRLQAAAYAAYAPGSVGRYVFVDPQLPPELAVAAIDSEDPAVRTTLHRVLSSLIRLWDQGCFFPRLEDVHGNEPRSCSYCSVSEACVRGDSGARRRLVRWVQEAPKDSERATLAAIVAEVFFIQDKQGGRDGSRS